jgi:hypothetical protein
MPTKLTFSDKYIGCEMHFIMGKLGQYFWKMGKILFEDNEWTYWMGKTF